MLLDTHFSPDSLHHQSRGTFDVASIGCQITDGGCGMSGAQKNLLKTGHAWAVRHGYWLHAVQQADLSRTSTKMSAHQEGLSDPRARTSVAIPISTNSPRSPGACLHKETQHVERALIPALHFHNKYGDKTLNDDIPSTTGGAVIGIAVPCKPPNSGSARGS